MLIDLHAHTWPRSHDSVLNPADLVERAKRAGLDAIIFTEHDTLWDEKDVREISERHSFPVFAGVEISTDDGHMLVFGIDKYVFGMHRSDQLAKYVEAADGAMVGAHPYRRQMPWYVRNEEEYETALQRAARNPAYAFCDGLEEINGRGSERENQFAKRLCDMMGMPGTGGTDSHAIQDIGKCATHFEREVTDVRGLIEEIKAGRFYAVDLRMSVAK